MTEEIKETNEAKETEQVVTKVISRDEMRKALFSIKAKSEIIDFQGVLIEIKAPCIGQVLDDSENTQNDRKEAFAQAVIRSCYVPGTDERVFEAGDLLEIVNWPAGDAINKLQAAMSKVMGVEISDHTKSTKDE